MRALSWAECYEAARLRSTAGGWHVSAVGGGAVEMEKLWVGPRKIKLAAKLSAVDGLCWVQMALTNYTMPNNCSSCAVPCMCLT